MDEIREAARQLSEKFPEDTRDPDANVAFRQLMMAYETLSDKERRAEYDRQRAQRRPGILPVGIQSSRLNLEVMNEDQLLYLLVMLRPPSARSKSTTPVNLALVFDRSTSMRAERLERVKAAARQVVEKLGPQDVISITTFSDRAEVISPAAHPEDKPAIVRQIRGVRTTGGTEIYQGLQAAYDQLRRAPLGHYINHLALLTDGHTYGDEEQCLRLARQAADQGITISAFGIGNDWNDDFLDQLVAPSGGRSAYVAHPEQIVTYLREEIRGLGTVYAQRLRVKNQLPQGVSCNYAIKLSPFAQPLDFSGEVVQLGAVEGRAPLIFLLELKVAPQQLGAQVVIPLTFLADIPSLQLEDRVFHYERRFRVVAEAEMSPPPQVVKAVEMLSLHRLNELAWKEFEVGNTLKATRRMDRLATRLMQNGHTKLAQQAALEKERLMSMDSLSASGRKQLKYGTRALLTRAITLPGNDD
jgi:Ca-activated chloride channel family protein